MAQTTHPVRQLRSLARRSRSEDYQMHIRICGTTAELHAVHLETGERFVARASEWDTVLNELNQLLDQYGPNESPSRQVAARQAGDVDRSPFVSRFLTSIVRRLRCQTGRS